ncbi:MAG: dihydroorotase, partial [Proteobacteria bacterium]|nr:dihydroorotase [Pseudomonadota bacterium]
MTPALHLRNARIVCPEGGERRGDLYIAHGVIAETPAENATVIDCGGLILAPGIV